MNVLFFLRLYPAYGGTERVTTVLANTFVERGHNVWIASYDHPSPEIIDAELSHAVRLVDLSYPLWNSNDVKKLHELVVEKSIDFVINQWATHHSPTVFFNKILNGTECKLITVHHNDPGTNARIQSIEMDIASGKGCKIVNIVKRWMTKTICRLSLRYTYNHSDLYLVLSPSFIPVAQKYIWKHDTPKMQSQFNPITREVIPYSESKRKEIIYVGRIEENQKRNSRLLDIWADLYEQFPDWTLTIVGNGPDMEDFRTRINVLKLKNINLEGFKNPIEYYQRASILVLTSEYEGFPLVIGEAMAYGVVPVVLGSFAAAHDIFDDGVAGRILPPPLDRSKFGDALAEIMSDELKLKSMSEQSLATSKRFSLSEIADRWEKLFNLQFKSSLQE